LWLSSSQLSTRPFPGRQRIGFSLTEWASIFELSTKWLFDDIKKLAFKQIDSKLRKNKIEYYIESILLGRRFRRSKWLLNGYITLAMRGPLITVKEAEAIGFVSSVLIGQIREKLGSFRRASLRGSVQDQSQAIKYIVSTKLREELENAGACEKDIRRWSGQKGESS
jgi:hypothetical protein